MYLFTTDTVCFPPGLYQYIAPTPTPSRSHASRQTEQGADRRRYAERDDLNLEPRKTLHTQR